MRRWAGLLLLCTAACGGDADFLASLSEASTQMCPTTVLEGVDVFDGTGTLDWSKLAAAGRRFVFIKTSQGDYNAQARFAANWAAAQTAGLARSPYHFFDPTVDGVTQAQWFLDYLSAAGGLTASDLPPTLDLECPTSATQSAASPNCEHSGASGWADPAVITQRALDWLDTVEAATGRKAILYSYVSWFASVNQTDPRFADHPLFIASYASCATVPLPWTAATFWQYSSAGSVSGIVGSADIDRFFGDEAALQQFILASAPAVDASNAPPSVDAASTPDLATPPAMDQGCTCQLSAGATSTPATGLLWIAVAMLARAWRRRSRSDG